MVLHWAQSLYCADGLHWGSSHECSNCPIALCYTQQRSGSLSRFVRSLPEQAVTRRSLPEQAVIRHSVPEQAATRRNGHGHVDLVGLSTCMAGFTMADLHVSLQPLTAACFLLHADQDSVRLLAVESCGAFAQSLSAEDNAQRLLPAVQNFSQVGGR